MKDRPQKQNGTRLSRSRRSRRSSASDSMVNVSDEENNVPYQIEANEWLYISLKYEIWI